MEQLDEQCKLQAFAATYSKWQGIMHQTEKQQTK